MPVGPRCDHICVLQCMDFGYHNSVKNSMLMYQNLHKNLSRCHQQSMDIVQRCVAELDAQADKQRFIELQNAAFMLPKKFEFQPCRGDEVQIPKSLYCSPYNAVNCVRFNFED